MDVVAAAAWICPVPCMWHFLISAAFALFGLLVIWGRGSSVTPSEHLPSHSLDTSWRGPFQSVPLFLAHEGFAHFSSRFCSWFDLVAFTDCLTWSLSQFLRLYNIVSFRITNSLHFPNSKVPHSFSWQPGICAHDVPTISARQETFASEPSEEEKNTLLFGCQLSVFTFWYTLRSNSAGDLFSKWWRGGKVCFDRQNAWWQ